jgi:predicted RND superfamily exporter protein
MLKKFAHGVVKGRVFVLIAAIVLLIPATLGYIHTKVNYDMLTYLPKDIDTMKGQDILQEEFGTGAFSMFICEGMDDKDVAELKDQIEEVDHVQNVIWYDSFADLSIPKEILPDKIYSAFNKDDSTMMVIIFDETTSEDGTTEACQEIRKLANKQCFLSGMTAVLIDTKELADKEAPIYIAIAVALSVVVLMLAMDSYLVPFLFLASIGCAVMYNLGSNNLILGEISYVTKAIAAVLQLGVTLDYSIFLWHSYSAFTKVDENHEIAMEHAIEETFTSVIGSSVTTIAGFIALCFMRFTLGLDLGLVMAKGVLLGVIACVTILPSLVLVFDKLLMKTSHKELLPDLGRIGGWVTRHAYVFMVIALVVLIPAVYGYNHTNVYYNLDRSLPSDLDSIVANEKLADEFDQQATHVLLISSDVEDKDIQKMAGEMEDVDGVKTVLGLNTIKSADIPDEMIPDDIRDSLENENWQLILISSEYKVASDEVNAQIDSLQEIAKSYDENSLLIGEAPATKDLIEITNQDFNTVNAVSIGIIFVIIALVFRSISLPFILVAVIELGIFINLGIGCYTGTEIPFIASIVIGTVQLGSTVDYAILLTTRYRRDRTNGMEKHEAVSDALTKSAKSILVSALSFFAATFGVGVYSSIDVVSSLCIMMARGALISMTCVIFVLPSMLLVFDKIITKTTKPQRG